MDEMRVLVGCWCWLIVSGCAAAPSCATAPTPKAPSAIQAVVSTPPSAPSVEVSEPAKASEPMVAVAADEKPAAESASDDTTITPAIDPLVGMTPEEMAQWIADRLREGEDLPSSQGLPAPRSASDNNPFALVRSATDIAASELPIVASPDGGRFAFLPPDNGEHPQLWIANRDGSEARQLVDLPTTQAKLAENEVGSIPSSSLFSPSFSPDGKKVYFMTDGWATSLALYSVDTKSLKTTFVTDANGYHVIDYCRDSTLVGSLVTYRHSYSQMLSAVDWYFLLDARGKSQGIVGPEPDSVDRFLANRCGAAVPKSKSIPKLLLSKPGCNDMVLRYEPKRFLDGTRVDLFYWVNARDASRPFESIESEEPSFPMGIEEAKSSLWEQCAIE